MSIAVCSCGEYGTAGCRHTNPYLATPCRGKHRCPQPADYKSRILAWECGTCHKVWQPTQFGWVEIRGASA